MEGRPDKGDFTQVSFDFFNTSNLAFGAKLTRAFEQLNDLLNSAEEHLQMVYGDLIIYGDYLDRNYLVPVPNRPDAACQTNQAFDIINDEATVIKEFKYDTEKEVLNVKLMRYNRVTNRMTIGEGTTTIKEGYCYIREAVSNNKPNLPVNFSRKLDASLGDIIYKYKVTENGIVQIDIQDEMMFLLKPSGSEHYTSVSFNKINNPKMPYEIDSPRGFLAVQNAPIITNGENYSAYFRVHLNDKEMWAGTLMGSGSYVPMYLRAGDKITYLENADLYEIFYNALD